MLTMFYHANGITAKERHSQKSTFYIVSCPSLCFLKCISNIEVY